MNVHLNFINKSDDTNNSKIVVFQKKIFFDNEPLPIAWHVFKNMGRDDNYPFTYPYQVQISAGDSYGNYSPQLNADDSQAFAVRLTNSGMELVNDGEGTDPRQIEFRNKLARGSVDANIFRAGKLLARRTAVVPNQRTAFRFEPRIWIGVASQIEEGQVMNSAIVSMIDTELSLLGIASSDIVMTGGGVGPNSTPFEFALKNVVMA